MMCQWAKHLGVTIIGTSANTISAALPRKARLKARAPSMPRVSCNVTVAEAKAALLTHLSQDLFPGGAKAGWWLKAVQLDLEAKGVIARSDAKPVRLYRCR